MNRWLTRKKDVGGEEPASAKKTRKTKKGQEDAKPAFDLYAALPQADDFRTSLIMPGLSTRFSMLREQDDPDSKIGKASDDSVLQPKRHSRLHEFGFVPGGLSDIAEVSSLNGSVRPPFASERTGSFDSSRDDDGSGSMMSRARPGEGNVLFGGRQKIYMISNNSTKGLGRTLYDDDVNMSAYQRLRAEEKERLQLQQDEHDDQQYEPSSPSAASRKRETSSSTNSGTANIRTSTAATSIASQGASSIAVSSPAFPPLASPAHALELNRSTTKARRLYDQGLDQHIQEQQSSAMNRLNSIQRARAPTGRSTPPIPLPQARSATNLNDRFNRGPAFRSDSPNAFGYSSMSRNNSSAGSSPILPRPQSPPLSPVSDTIDEAQALSAALQPHDRGKATAMGAFNKPKEAFSEEEYAERLRHLQQEREIRDVVAPKSEKSPARKPTLRERAEQERRKRADSEVNEQQRPEAPAKQIPTLPSAFSRFQAAASQMKTAGPATSSPPLKQKQLPASAGTFFASPDSSDAEEEMAKPLVSRAGESARRFENLPVATGPAPSIFEHPALRSRAPSEEKITQAVQSLKPRASPQSESSSEPEGSDVDSPTLGPENGGLSGMIRQHLRNVSNVSSNYGEPGPPITSPPATTPAGLALQTHEIGFQRRQPGSESVTPAPSTYSHSNPWDLDDIDNPYRDEQADMDSVSLVDERHAAPLVMSATEPSSAAPWDLTPRRHHERIASNETEAEHEAFQRDLAQKQRLIQESLRARAEGRSTSPAPGPTGGLKTALNMLRAKSSRESFATIEQPTKPMMRKLTLGANSANVSSTSLVGMNSSYGPEMPPLRTKPSRVLQQSEQDAQRELESRQRSGTDGSRTGRPTGRSPPVSTRSSTRERSSSGTSRGRSQSRSDRYRDDIEQAMVEGSRSVYPANTMPSIPGYVAHPTPPLPAERPALDTQTRARSRSNSKTAASNYFEAKHLQPIQTGPVSGNASPHLPVHKYSPGTPISPRPSPGGFNHHATSPMLPFAANQTPPVSNPTTPNAAAFNPGAVQPLIRQGVLRKKSVAKSDISEPVFISTTSAIDLVNLPPGASLKNGQQSQVPPVPPINPKRRKFGFGRGEPQQNPYDPAVQSGMENLRAPYAEPIRTNSSGAIASQSPQPRNRLRKTSSEGKSLRGTASGPGGSSPAVPQGNFAARNDSPPRSFRSQPIAQRSMDGAMF
ncbi:hypothetical protein ACN47E_009747 [Coniothyrium glycines]